MRRAEWRRRADDPKSALGWWWRGLVDSRFRDLQIVFCLTTMLGAYFRVPWAIVPTLCALPFAWWARYRPRRDRLDALLQDPSPTVRITASVTYRRDAMTTGSDRMALMLVDGWLVGEGVRSDFALRRQDVRSMSGIYDQGFKLVLTDETQVSLSGIGDLERRALRDWHRAGVAPEGEPTFPPARVHPQELARWMAYTPVGMFLIFAPNAAAALLRLESGLGDVKIAIALVGFGVALYGWWQLGRLAEITKTFRRQEALAGGAPPLRESDVECGDSSPLGSADSSARRTPADVSTQTSTELKLLP